MGKVFTDPFLTFKRVDFCAFLFLRTALTRKLLHSLTQVTVAIARLPKKTKPPSSFADRHRG